MHLSIATVSNRKLGQNGENWREMAEALIVQVIEAKYIAKKQQTR
jgi:hypothetical protein